MEVPIMRKFSVAGAVLACLALAAGPEAADPSTATAQFAVTADVATVCQIAATGLAFGTYNPAVVLDAQSTIGVQCTANTTYTVGLNAGTAPGATVTSRQMTNTTAPSSPLLSYSLFSDAARTVNWGDIGGTGLISGTGTGSGQLYSVYGQIPAGQTTIEAGGFQDTITATVSF